MQIEVKTDFLFSGGHTVTITTELVQEGTEIHIYEMEKDKAKKYLGVISCNPETTVPRYIMYYMQSNKRAYEEAIKQLRKQRKNTQSNPKLYI